MLQIRNVADFPVMVSTSYMGGQGRPLYVKVAPGDHALVAQEDLKKWPNGAKENLAESMKMGHLVVNELEAVHYPKDDGHKLPEYIACTLGSAILNIAGSAPWNIGVSTPPPPPTVAGFAQVYEAHVLNAGVHNAPDAANIVPVATPYPTDLPSLIVYVVAVQTAYDAHIAAAVHANADTFNATSVVPADLPTSIQAIEELYGLFNAHKKQFSAPGALLTPNQVIAYV